MPLNLALAQMTICLVCGVWIVIDRLVAGEPNEALWLGLLALGGFLLPLLLGVVEMLFGLISEFQVSRPRSKERD